MVVMTLQIFTVLSRLPLATFVPSGENATEYTQLVCPISVATHLPLTTLQIFTVLSRLPLATCAPSGEYATDDTESLCPFSVATHAPVATLQIFTVLSQLPLATCVPSGENATDRTLLLCPFIVLAHMWGGSCLGRSTKAHLEFTGTKTAVPLPACRTVIGVVIAVLFVYLR